LISLQRKIDTQSLKTVSWYRKEQTDAIPIPVLGPDVFDPRQDQILKETAQAKQTEQAQG
jgi:NADH-quinone oxidoreductase subunit B